MLSLNGISKSFGSNDVLRDINFQVEPGQIVVLLGPSGTGKSTLLSIVAGLVKPDSGKVFLNDVDVTNQAVHKRGITLLTQKANLFPFMSVAQNVGFSPNIRSLKKSERDEKVNDLLEEVLLTGYNNRDPETLSGGEQQRVALARALSSEPKVLLLDEPFASLDQNIRLKHQKLLKDLVSSSSVPVIFVTHQLEEAMALADQIIIINESQLWCRQTPQELYERPENAMSARTVGFNVIDCDQIIWVNNPNVDTRNYVCVRPENVVLDDVKPQLLSKCVGYSFVGRGYRFNLELSDGQVIDLLTDKHLDSNELEKIVSNPELGVSSDFWISLEK